MAVTVAPREWTASTVRWTSSAVKGGAVAVGAVQVQLDQVGAGTQLTEGGGGQEPVPSLTSTGSPAGRQPVRASQPPATRT